MPVPTSPLRYPGGKTCLYQLTAEILRMNKATRREYAEPYAGGCGLALSLLYGGVVSDIHINDIDPAIWSFWHSVLNATQALTDLIERVPVTMDEWHHQKKVFRTCGIEDPLTLGFAAFYLNRTNRSGIIKGGGVIGGLEQKGNYKIDCRFNKETLLRRIHRVAKYRNRIHLTNLDAIEFIANKSNIISPTAFFCIDPPYFNKGSSLYTSFYKPDDHRDLCAAVSKLDNPWIVTYDDTPEIRKLYRHRRQFSFDINYSVQTKRVGTELLVASKWLRLPKEVKDRQVCRAR